MLSWRPPWRASMAHAGNSCAPGVSLHVPVCLFCGVRVPVLSSRWPVAADIWDSECVLWIISSSHVLWDNPPNCPHAGQVICMFWSVRQFFDTTYCVPFLLGCRWIPARTCARGTVNLWGCSQEQRKDRRFLHMPRNSLAWFLRCAREAARGGMRIALRRPYFLPFSI